MMHHLVLLTWCTWNKSVSSFLKKIKNIEYYYVLRSIGFWLIINICGLDKYNVDKEDTSWFD